MRARGSPLNLAIDVKRCGVATNGRGSGSVIVVPCVSSVYHADLPNVAKGECTENKTCTYMHERKGYCLNAHTEQ